MTTILPILFLYLNTVIVTAGTYEPYWKRKVWRLKIWFNPPFLLKCLYQVRVITVFTVFRLLTDFVCLYTYEFWLPLWKIVRSSVILLLPILIYGLWLPLWYLQTFLVTDNQFVITTVEVLYQWLQSNSCLLFLQCFTHLIYLYRNNCLVSRCN